MWKKLIAMSQAVAKWEVECCTYTAHGNTVQADLQQVLDGI